MTRDFFGRLVKEIGLLSYKLFASGSFDGLVQIWDINSGNVKCTLDGHNGGIEARVTTSRGIPIASLSIKFLTGVFFCLCKDATQLYVQILNVIQKAILDFE
ncbi:hypothetical protein LOK49_LG06G00325, partial [Camellia lanceoleosa]